MRVARPRALLAHPVLILSHVVRVASALSPTCGAGLDAETSVCEVAQRAEDTASMLRAWVPSRQERLRDNRETPGETPGRL